MCILQLVSLHAVAVAACEIGVALDEPTAAVHHAHSCAGHPNRFFVQTLFIAMISHCRLSPFCIVFLSCRGAWRDDSGGHRAVHLGVAGVNFRPGSSSYSSSCRACSRQLSARRALQGTAKCLALAAAAVPIKGIGQQMRLALCRSCSSCRGGSGQLSAWRLPQLQQATAPGSCRSCSSCRRCSGQLNAWCSPQLQQLFWGSSGQLSA